MNETLIENIDISSKLNKNSLSNEKEINKTKLNVNSSIKPFTDDNSNNQNYCPICGKLLLHEIKNIDNNSTEDELKNTFSFNDRICNRCRGPFQHVIYIYNYSIYIFFLIIFILLVLATVILSLIIFKNILMIYFIYIYM